jgi:hypothetical protein
MWWVENEIEKMHTLAKEPFDEIGEWRNVVHPLPPPELAVRLHHTIATYQTQRISPRSY